MALGLRSPPFSWITAVAAAFGRGLGDRWAVESDKRESKMVVFRDDEFRSNAQKWEQNVEVDDSGRYKVACLNATAYGAYEGPLNGIRFWFEQEEYYVVVGCPPWISTKMAADGRWAKNVSKYWDQCWEDTVEPRFICEEWGFTKKDTNMYHVKGWGSGVMEGLHDLERRLGIVLAQTDYENYGRHLVMRIKEGLKALDPTWQKTEDDFDAKYNQDHAKDVVQRSEGGWAHHRDGTTSISYF
ncbi:hypothetical protein BP00DRAFT_497771 [Aspergillus indologenus CBS 114.80]|uniref:Uncharacterized protein n=1 Tax=Aspergillus indologenus CBS 114.80 TaxID=1450541 RepID=A0A2V5IUZ7_9EURO|nr:hypothetical protein BP00DRAFT_497771 [Aspergillus indologenus CBS 114.80]